MAISSRPLVSMAILAIASTYTGIRPVTVEAAPAAIVSRAGTENSLMLSMTRAFFQNLGDGSRSILFGEERPTTATAGATGPFRTTCGMDEAMVTLFLQSYNAGPYAVTRFNGQVPYRETRAYTPKVMRFYQQDLDNTPYDAMIVESATRHGLDPQLIRAIMKAESNFRNRTTSRAGARGLMQVMPVTWRAVQKRNGISWNYSAHVFNPAKNIEVACAYLSWIRYEHLPRHFASFRQDGPSQQGGRTVASAPRSPQESANRASATAIRPIRVAVEARAVPGAVVAARQASTAPVRSTVQFSWAR